MSNSEALRHLVNEAYAAWGNRLTQFTPPRRIANTSDIVPATRHWGEALPYQAVFNNPLVTDALARMFGENPSEDDVWATVMHTPLGIADITHRQSLDHIEYPQMLFLGIGEPIFLPIYGILQLQIIYLSYKLN